MFKLILKYFTNFSCIFNYFPIKSPYTLEIKQIDERNFSEKFLNQNEWKRLGKPFYMYINLIQFNIRRS